MRILRIGRLEPASPFAIFPENRVRPPGRHHIFPGAAAHGGKIQNRTRCVSVAQAAACRFNNFQRSGFFG
jgi:hypothetical protein